jgi:hypothetical protein
MSMFEYVVEVWWRRKGKRETVEVCELPETAEALVWDYRDDGHWARVKVVKHQQEG